MGLMDRAMADMVGGLPVAEREALLLKMMPEMMKQTDITRLTKNMVGEMAGLVNLLMLYDLIQTGLQDDDLRSQIRQRLERLHEKLPEMHEMMQPMMVGVMSAVMPKMMDLMRTLMPNLHEMMPQVMEEAMIPILQNNPDIKSHMLGMMQTMFPHCAANLFPLIDKDERNAFITRLYGIMARSGTKEMNADEKKRFVRHSSEAVRDALCSNPNPATQ